MPTAPVNVIPPVDPRQAFMEAQKAKDQVMKDMMATIQMSQQIRAQQDQMDVLKKNQEYTAWWNMMSEASKSHAGGMAGMIGTQPGLFKYGFLNFLDMSPDQADIAVENLRTNMELNPTAQAELMFSRIMSRPDYAAKFLAQAPAVVPSPTPEAGSSSSPAEGVTGDTSPEPVKVESEPEEAPAVEPPPAKPTTGNDFAADLRLSTSYRLSNPGRNFMNVTNGKSYGPEIDLLVAKIRAIKDEPFRARVALAMNLMSDLNANPGDQVIGRQLQANIDAIAKVDKQLALEIASVVPAALAGQNPPATRATSGSAPAQYRALYPSAAPKAAESEPAKPTPAPAKAPATSVVTDPVVAKTADVIANEQVAGIGEKAQDAFLTMVQAGADPVVTQAGMIANNGNKNLLNFAAQGNTTAQAKIQKDGVKAVEDLHLFESDIRNQSGSGPEYRRAQRFMETAAANQYMSTFETTAQHLMNVFQRTNIADAMGDLMALATAGGEGLQNRKQLEVTLKQLAVNAAAQFASLGIEGYNAETDRTYKMGMLQLSEWEAKLKGQGEGILADPTVKYILTQVDGIRTNIAKTTGNNFQKFDNEMNKWYNANPQNAALYDAYLGIISPMLGASTEKRGYNMTGLGKATRQFVSLFGFLNGTGFMQKLNMEYPVLTTNPGSVSPDDLVKSLNDPAQSALLKQILAKYQSSLGATQ